MLKTKDYLKAIWQDFDELRVPSLSQDETTDVCVVGAGIAGLTTAYYLVNQGLSVVVIDDGVIGGRQTLRTTAHLSNAFDDRYFEVDKLHGKETSKKVAASHTWAIEEVGRISATESIDSDYHKLPGYLFLAPEHKENLLHNELRSAHEAGLTDVQFIQDVSINELKLGPCLKFHNQARFNPTSYVLGLARKILERGGKLYKDTRAETIKGGEGAHVITKRGMRIDCKSIVVATNSPVNTLVKFHIKQSQYRSYVIACPIPSDAFPEALLWDTGDPYYYVRTQEHEGKTYLIVGGEDHKTGQLEKGLHPNLKLYRWAKDMFPFIGKVEFHWSGQVVESVDHLAYIGSLGGSEENVYVVTADSGQGTTHGTIAGKIISDQIRGIKNEWSDIYDPNRATLGAAYEFVKENLNVGLQYRDWVTPKSNCADTRLPKNGGAVCSEGLKKRAVFRDEKGDIHHRTAVCTHLGGIVRWNEAEKTWDCPCHGSRFNGKGEVINGPAKADLKEVQLKEEIKLGADVPNSSVKLRGFSDQEDEGMQILLGPEATV